MKRTVRVFTCLLALLMLVSMAVACEQKEPETGEKQTAATEGSVDASVTETEGEAIPEIEKKDYNDTVFLEVSGGLDYMWAEKRDQSVVTEAIYDRQVKIQDHIGVEIMGKLAEGDHEHYHEGFCNSQKTKDGSIDIFFAGSYMSVPLIIRSGYVRNLKNVSGLNLDAEYWNTAYMESIALKDRYYLGYNDFTIPKTYVISFNKELMEKYNDALDESIYDTVRGYRWTVDKMISLSRLVYIDRTGDGKTQDDTFGITGQQWMPFINFVQASDMQLVDMNESGDYVVSVYNDENREKTTTLIDKLKEMAGSDSAWFRYRIEPTPMIGLETGRTLMSLIMTTGLEDYLQYELSFGVLPYPMYDEYQKDVGYRSLNFDGYLTIPSYLRNEEMIVDTVELLAFWGEPVRIALFEKMLGKQVSDSPDDSAMLDIVWDGICSDFGLTYSHLVGALDNNLYMMPTLTNPKGSEQAASYIAGYTRGANNAIVKFMKAIDKLPE